MPPSASLAPLLALAATFLLGGPLTSLAADPLRLQEVLRQQYTVADGGQLVIQADRGSITVTGSESGTAQLEVLRKVRPGAEDRAPEILANHEVRFSQVGNTLRIDSKVGQGGRRLWNWRGPDLEIEFRISLPRRFDLDATTAGGGIRVSQLAGRHALRTSGGSIHLESLAGTVKAQTSGGSIRGGQLTGDVDAATSGGSIQLDGVAGDRLKAKTSGGSIQLRGVSVPAEAHTSGGSITVETSSAPLVASTAGGSIHATFTSAPRAEATLRTSGGSVNLTLPPDAAFQLDAATTGGGVRSEFPVPVTTSTAGIRGTLAGPVNGGGPVLKLRTTGGSIRVRKP